MNWYLIVSIVIASVVTVMLRAIPFIAFSGDKQLPPIINYLGKTLPYAIMGMLVVFCMKDTSFAVVSRWAPQLIASLLVVLTYVWKKSTILSIVAGTACYMILIQMVFV